MDFSYRIPAKKIGNTINWKIGEKGTTGVVIKHVSVWALQLFTKQKMEDKFVQLFKDIVQEYSPENSINWEETFKAVNAQNEYNLLVTTEKDSTDSEILSILEKKYDLD